MTTSLDLPLLVNAPQTIKLPPPKRSTYDTALSMTFTTSSPRPYSAIGETHCESGFVAKHHCVPLSLSESDMTSIPQKSLLTMYTGKNGTEVWPSGSQSSGAQAVSGGLCGYPPSHELHAGGSCCRKAVTEMT